MGKKEIHELSALTKEFNDFFSNFENYISEKKLPIDLLNTKLGKIKKDLQKINDISDEKLTRLANLIHKYCSLKGIFSNQYLLKDENLKKIIKGRHDYKEDMDEEYNNYLFELSTACRFSRSIKITYKEDLEVDLSTICDIVFNKSLAIECKYIHSQLQVLNNFKEAKKQIETRVKKNIAINGFIALDISNILPQKKINEFIKNICDIFTENYELLKDKIDIYEGVAGNKHLLEIISLYIAHESEVLMYGKNLNSADQGKEVLAILYQSINTFIYHYERERIPITTRSTGFFINKELDNDLIYYTDLLIKNSEIGF